MIKVMVMTTAHLVKTGTQTSLGAKTQMMNGVNLIMNGATFQPSVKVPFQQFTLKIPNTRISSIGGSVILVIALDTITSPTIS